MVIAAVQQTSVQPKKAVCLSAQDNGYQCLVLARTACDPLKGEIIHLIEVVVLQKVSNGQQDLKL